MMRAAVVVLLGVTLLPTAAGLLAALAGAASAEAYAQLFAQPGVSRAIGLSLFTGITSTLLALVLAHALVALAVSGGWRRRLTGLSLPLLALPHLALGIGLVLVLAPGGLLLRLFSPWATGLELPPDWHTVRDPWGLSLILGLVIKETCFLIMALTAALAQVRAQKRLQQTATLGYGALKGWAVAVAPALHRQSVLPVAAVLAYGIGNVDLALTLGPDLPPTFAVLLWRFLLDPAVQAQSMAQAGTVVLLAMTLGAMALLALLQNVGRGLWHRVATGGGRARRERGARLALGATAWAGLALGLSAIAAIGLRALSGPWRFPNVFDGAAGNNAVPDALASAWSDAWPAVATTLPTTALLALLTTAVAIALVLPAAEALRQRQTLRARVGQWLFVPLLLPQMTFLFGIQVLLIRAHVDGTLVAVTRARCTRPTAKRCGHHAWGDAWRCMAAGYAAAFVARDAAGRSA